MKENQVSAGFAGNQLHGVCCIISMAEFKIMSNMSPFSALIEKCQIYC